MEVGERPPEERQDARHPGHEGAAVVAHDLERDAHQLEAVTQPGQDGLAARSRQDAQADEETAVVVDEADDPDLRVVALGALQEEGALDVDVPQLIGSAPLVAWTPRPTHRGPRRALLGEEGIDGVVAERVDVAPRQLRGQALAVPVGQEAHHDDGPLDPGRQARSDRT